MSGQVIATIAAAAVYGSLNLAGTIYAANRANRAASHADHAKNLVSDVKASVGDSNGKTLGQLAKENHQALTTLIEHDAYTHDRNHDMIGLLVNVSLGNHLIGKQMGIEIPAAKDPRKKDDGPDNPVR